MSIGVDEFPILGEPFVVEFANTSYLSPAGSLDFLGDRRDVPTWFGVSPTAGPFFCPARPGISWHLQLLKIRDAARACLDALAAGSAPPAGQLDVIAATAATVPRRRSIDWAERPVLVVTYKGPAAQQVLAMIADYVIDFVTSDRAGLVSVCQADDCPMLFVRHHHRRRWCHDGCSHRDRQARYYRRQRQRPARP